MSLAAGSARWSTDVATTCGKTVNHAMVVVVCVMGGTATREMSGTLAKGGMHEMCGMCGKMPPCEISSAK